MNAFDYYLNAWKNYAEFNGRARRSEYWFYVLFNILAMFTTLILDGFLIGLPIFTFSYAVASIIPSIAVLVRRLHDTNKSGWWYFIAFVPFVGSIVLLVFLFSEGDRGVNEYGIDPKNPLVLEDDISRHLVQ